MKETTWDAALTNVLLMEIQTALWVNLGEKDERFSQHITQLMNDQNALFAEIHLSMFFKLTAPSLKHKLTSLGWEIYSSNLGVTVYSHLVSRVFLAVLHLLCLSSRSVLTSGNCGQAGRRNKNSRRSCPFTDCSHMWWRNSVFVRSVRWRKETIETRLFRSTIWLTAGRV